MPLPMRCLVLCLLDWFLRHACMLRPLLSCCPAPACPTSPPCLPAWLCAGSVCLAVCRQC